MQLLAWQERFSVGVKEFDQHHKILFEMINSLIIAKNENSEFRVVKNSLDQLAAYTIYHFTAEEAMMEYFGLDSLDEHRAEHTKLLNQVKAYQAKITTADDVSIDENA